jgi:integrase
MSVYKAPDGRKKPWIAQYKDAKGKWRAKGFRLEGQAKDALKKFEDEVANGVYIHDSEAMTFGEVAKLYLEHCEKRSTGKNQDMESETISSKTGIFRRLLIPKFSSVKVNKISPKDAEDFLDEIKPKYSADYCRIIITNISCALSFAVKKELGLMRNPLKDNPPKLPPSRTREDEEIPEFEDVHKMLLFSHEQKPSGVSIAVWEQQRVLLYLIAFGGLRSGECLGMNREFINLDPRHATMDVRQQLNRRGQLRPPKYKSRRIVPVNAMLLPVLSAYINGGPATGPLFLTRSGERPCARWLGVRLSELEMRAGITNPAGTYGKYSPHTLRHFAGSAWLAQGARLEDVSRWLGHKNIKTTWKIYMHQLRGDDYSRRMADTMIERFPGIPALPVPILDLHATPVQQAGEKANKNKGSAV